MRDDFLRRRCASPASYDKVIEIALLYEDHTWDTATVEIPWNDSEQSAEEAISAWFEATGSKKAEYRDVVQVALYSLNPGRREDESIDIHGV